MLAGIPDLEAKNKSFEGGERPLEKECFTFLSLIGSGAFGKVYRAASKKTNTNYAIKILTKAQISKLKLNDQLKNEISILARCNHENIIKLYGAYEDNTFISLVMEIAEQGSLYKKLQQAKKFSEPKAAEILNDVIHAISYLHSMTPPILHRDLKPENVLISNGRYKIADFGWSNVDDEFRNTFCGTPDYLAPEMIRGDGHNEKLDVWTIGILMYELLHGKPPFSPKEKMMDKRMAQKMIEKNVLEGNIVFDPAISKEAEAAIRTLLNPISAERPTAKDIFELEFFKIHKQIKPEIKRQNSAANIDMNDPTQIKNLLIEYQNKLEKLTILNSSLDDMLQNKDRLLETQKKEIDALQSRVKRLEEDRYSTSTESTKKDFELLSLESNRQKEEIIKMQKTLDYMYIRTKDLALYVSEFYLKTCDEEQLKIPINNPLSYESTFEKLRLLFKNYLDYKAVAKGIPRGNLPDVDIRLNPYRVDKSPIPLRTETSPNKGFFHTNTAPHNPTAVSPILPTREKSAETAKFATVQR